MSRSSTATVRHHPVAQRASASGAFRVHSESFVVDTTEHTAIIDITERVSAIVHKLGIREGLASVCSMHTTCTLFINEYQVALRSDMKAFLEHVVDSNGGYLHNDPAHSDCDRANADSHLRAMLLGNGLTLQVSGADVVLGQWQRILMAELDGPRPRTLRVQVMGV
jgi:secondary thiamine-phosphate synthase enzyme